MYYMQTQSTGTRHGGFDETRQSSTRRCHWAFGQLSWDSRTESNHCRSLSLLLSVRIFPVPEHSAFSWDEDATMLSSAQQSSLATTESDFIKHGTSSIQYYDMNNFNFNCCCYLFMNNYVADFKRVHLVAIIIDQLFSSCQRGVSLSDFLWFNNPQTFAVEKQLNANVHHVGIFTRIPVSLVLH